MVEGGSILLTEENEVGEDHQRRDFPILTKNCPGGKE